MSRLSEAVHELTRDHQVKISKKGESLQLAEEYSLLSQLESAKEHGTHAGTTGSGGAKLPVGATALDLEESIIYTIHTTASPHNRYRLASMPLPERVREWARITDDRVALDYVEGWSELIRDLFRTKFFVVARCPMCGESEYLEQGNGELKRKDALMVTVETATAVCLCCKSIWVGADELNNLNSHL